MVFTTAPEKTAMHEVIEAIVNATTRNQHVLWLVSGGSCIVPEVYILQHLPNTAIEKITVMLVDERFGTAGHPDSNYEKLVNAGFSRNGLLFEDLLTRTHTLQEAAAEHANQLRESVGMADTIIATMGIGQDGHTAGILPHSVAAADTLSIAIGYVAQDYPRITAGFPLLRKINKAFIFAYGAPKQAPLARIQAARGTLSSLPSLVLYDIADVKIYNDNISNEEGL